MPLSLNAIALGSTSAKPLAVQARPLPMTWKSWSKEDGGYIFSSETLLEEVTVLSLSLVSSLVEGISQSMKERRTPAYCS